MRYDYRAYIDIYIIFFYYLLQRYMIAVYDAVYVYIRALHQVLASGGDPKNGTAIFDNIRSSWFISKLHTNELFKI